MRRKLGKMVSIKGGRGFRVALLFVVFPGGSARRIEKGERKMKKILAIKIAAMLLFSAVAYAEETIKICEF